MFIVIYTDYGETCDQHSRKLGVFRTPEEAEKAVAADMEMFIFKSKKENAGTELDIRPLSHEIWQKGEVGSCGCVWDVIPV